MLEQLPSPPEVVGFFCWICGGLAGWVPVLTGCGNVEADPCQDVSKISLVVFAEKLTEDYLVGLNPQFVEKINLGIFV